MPLYLRLQRMPREIQGQQGWSKEYFQMILTEDFLDFFSMYRIQHCFICRPSDSTVSEDVKKLKCWYDSYLGLIYPFISNKARSISWDSPFEIYCSWRLELEEACVPGAQEDQQERAGRIKRGRDELLSKFLLLEYFFPELVFIKALCAKRLI